MIVEADVRKWLDSEDEMMVGMANSCIGEETIQEENLKEALKFLNIFSLGFREIGLNSLADIYSKRTDLFIGNSLKLHISKKLIKEACNEAVYAMLESNREKEIRRN